MSDRDFSSCPHLRTVRAYNKSCKPQVVSSASGFKQCFIMHPFGASLNWFGLFLRQNGCCLRIGFSSNQIRSFLQLVANRYLIGYFG